MINLRLERYAYQTAWTLGRMAIDNDMLATLEAGWRDNAFNVSCVPPGVYALKWFDSPHLGKVLHLLDVPGREAILIHAGNEASQTRGCILVGMHEVHTRAGAMLSQSDAAVQLLLNRYWGKTEMQLAIVHSPDLLLNSTVTPPIPGWTARPQ